MAWTTITLFWIGVALVGGMLIGSFIHVGYGRVGAANARSGRGKNHGPGT